VCLVVGSGFSAWAQTPEQFRFSKSIEREPARDEEIVACPLDSDVYAATRESFPDLRLVDEAGAEVPYQLEPDVEFREDRTRRPFATEVVALREEGPSIEVRLRLPDKSPTADGFTLMTPQTNYERHVQVFGSRDGTDWKPLVTDGLLFDYSRYMDVSQREIALPANDCREFKLVLGEVTDERESPFKELTRTFRGGQEAERVERTTVERRTLRIDRIAAWHTDVQQRVRKTRTTVYPIAGFEIQEDREKKQTLVTIRTRREPLTSFVLKTTSRNFSRPATLEIPVVQGVKTSWRTLGSATFSQLGFRNYHREQLTIEFPVDRQAEYRLVIYNEDNPPLEIQDVQAEGPMQRVVWLAQPGKAYQLFYGSETAATPHYETAIVLAALRREDFQPLSSNLGSEAKNTGYGGDPSLTVRRLLNNWYFLGAVIGLMVLALTWSLFRAGRHLAQLPPEGASQD
jgi:hypothetical protein